MNDNMATFLKVTTGLEVLKYFGFQPQFLFISDILPCRLGGVRDFIGGHSGFAANAITMLQREDDGNFRISLFGKGDGAFLDSIKKGLNKSISDNKGCPLDISLIDGNGEFRDIVNKGKKIVVKNYESNKIFNFEELYSDSDFSEFPFRLNNATTLGLMCLREAQSTEFAKEFLNKIRDEKLRFKPNTILFINSNLVIPKMLERPVKYDRRLESRLTEEFIELLKGAISKNRKLPTDKIEYRLKTPLVISMGTDEIKLYFKKLNIEFHNSDFDLKEELLKDSSSAKVRDLAIKIGWGILYHDRKKAIYASPDMDDAIISNRIKESDFKGNPIYLHGTADIFNAGFIFALSVKERLEELKRFITDENIDKGNRKIMKKWIKHNELKAKNISIWLEPLEISINDCLRFAHMLGGARLSLLEGEKSRKSDKYPNLIDVFNFTKVSNINGINFIENDVLLELQKIWDMMDSARADDVPTLFKNLKDKNLLFNLLALKALKWLDADMVQKSYENSIGDEKRIVFLDLDDTLMSADQNREKSIWHAFVKLKRATWWKEIENKIVVVKNSNEEKEIILKEIILEKTPDLNRQCLPEGYRLAIVFYRVLYSHYNEIDTKILAPSKAKRVNIKRNWNSKSLYALVLALTNEETTFVEIIKKNSLDTETLNFDDISVETGKLYIDEKEKIEDAYKAFNETHMEAYLEAKELLQTLQLFKIEYFVVTDGDEEPQWEKIERTGLSKYIHTKNRYISTGGALTPQDTKLLEDKKRDLENINIFNNEYIRKRKNLIIQHKNKIENSKEDGEDFLEETVKVLMDDVSLFNKHRRTVKACENFSIFIETQKNKVFDFYRFIIYAVSRYGEGAKEYLRILLPFNEILDDKLIMVGDKFNKDIVEIKKCTQNVCGVFMLSGSHTLDQLEKEKKEKTYKADYHFRKLSELSLMISKASFWNEQQRLGEVKIVSNTSPKLAERFEGLIISCVLSQTLDDENLIRIGKFILADKIRLESQKSFAELDKMFRNANKIVDEDDLRNRFQLEIIRSFSHLYVTDMRKSCIEHLIKLSSSDHNRDIQIGIIEVLGKIGDFSQIEWLLRKREEADDKVSGAIDGALFEIRKTIEANTILRNRLSLTDINTDLLSKLRSFFVKENKMKLTDEKVKEISKGIVNIVMDNVLK